MAITMEFISKKCILAQKYVLRFIYNFIIHLVALSLKVIAPFNSKIKKGVVGRQSTFKLLKSKLNPSDQTIWFHCASLGEYEQGLPVFMALKSAYPHHKIVLSFFSPSGYEVRKHVEWADVVVYLPLDRQSYAQRFLRLTHPELVVFVKYDIWPNMLHEIKKHAIKAILISALFRKHQIYFKWYGGLMKQALFTFDHIFTQDENSLKLLDAIQYQNASVAGDTRFDRVTDQLNQDNTVDFIADFKGDFSCIVFGSTWPADDLIYMNFINNNCNSELKFVIAPHDIKPSYIQRIRQQLKCSTVLYSELPKRQSELAETSVFILDTIGYLGKVYAYSDIAYVGGAAGTTGLHNILEPAVFGQPIIIGSNYEKFPEAQQLIALGGGFSVADHTQFSKTTSRLLDNRQLLKKTGQLNLEYVQKHAGAVIQIMDFIRTI